MTIVELREKRAKLWATMEGFLDTHRNDKGVLSAEDDAVYANMEKELNDLTNEVRRMERRDAIAAELAKPVSSPITEQPQKAAGEAKTGRASGAYREDFGLHLRGKRMLHNVLSEGVDANGGYLVPTEFEKFIVDTLKEENVMRRLCKVITTDNERKIPVAATHSTAAWTAENAAYTESNPTFAQKTIDAYKLTDLVKVSIELLDDSAFDLEEYIAREFAYAFGAAEEQAFCVGTGTGQPTGLFTANGGTVGVTAASRNHRRGDLPHLRPESAVPQERQVPDERRYRFRAAQAEGFQRSVSVAALPAGGSAGPAARLRDLHQSVCSHVGGGCALYRFRRLPELQDR